MSLLKSITTFGGFTILSRVTGYIRDMALARYLGAGLISDAFFAAFKIPNLFRSLFAEGAFTSAFVPMVSGKLDDREKAMAFASQAISVLAFFLTIFIIIVEFFMPLVVEILTPGFIGDPGKVELATTLSRITFPFLLFISIVSFQSGVLNSLGKFAAPASAPCILNIFMVISIFACMPFVPTTAHGAAIGVTIAGILEVIWLGYILRKNNFSIKPILNIFTVLKDKEIKTLFRRIAPGIIGSGIYQINMLIDLVIVSLVGTGAMSWLYYANRIQQLPLGVVGAAISVALLPILSKHLKKGETNEAKQSQDKAVEYGALLSIPSAIALAVLAEPIVNILFQHGKFGAYETQMTYPAVIIYALSLPFYVLVKALSPNFFARGDTKTPVKYGIIVFVSNLIFALLLMGPFGHLGIASATSLASLVSFYQYSKGLKKRRYWSFSPQLIRQIIKITLCSVFMGFVLEAGELFLNHHFTNWLEFGFIVKVFYFALLCGFGGISFLIIAKITGTFDIYDALKLLRKGKKNA